MPPPENPAIVMAHAEDQATVEPAGRAGTGWLVVGLQRGAALPVLYGVSWIAVGWVADRVMGSETGAVTLGVLVTLFGVPVGVLAGMLLAAICAAVDRRSDRRLPRRTVAARVIGAAAAATALLTAAAFDYWAFFVGGPCALGLLSLWVWPLPERPPPPSDSARSPSGFP